MLSQNSYSQNNCIWLLSDQPNKTTVLHLRTHVSTGYYPNQYQHSEGSLTMLKTKKSANMCSHCGISDCYSNKHSYIYIYIFFNFLSDGFTVSHLKLPDSNNLSRLHIVPTLNYYYLVQCYIACLGKTRMHL